MRNFIIFLLQITLILLCGTLFAQDHIVISEILVTPTNGEFVEIYNPTAMTVDLSNYYMTDATFAGGGTFYYKTVTGNGGGGDFWDFNARFPDGAQI
ncbi:MAG: lamin tail domain-containing protein, partial [bacterium]